MIAFYLIVLRPQQQEQSGQQKDIKDLQVGDEVLTTSGFLGTVQGRLHPGGGPVQMVIDFGNGVVMNALSSAIAQRVAAGPDGVSRGALASIAKRRGKLMRRWWNRLSSS